MNIYYRESKLASALCIIGCLVGIGGVVALIDLKSVEYLLVIAMGFGMMYIGTLIGEKKTYQKWIASQDKTKLEKKIKKSITFAMEQYQECPNKYTYEYIKGLNPEAGTYIGKERAENRRNRMLPGKKK